MIKFLCKSRKVPRTPRLVSPALPMESGKLESFEKVFISKILVELGA